MRTKELAKLRRLAQEVLLQRSDVEAFLVSSIHHVRAELAAGALPASPTAAGAAAAGEAPRSVPAAGGSDSHPARTESEASSSVESVEGEERAAADASCTAGGQAALGGSHALAGGASTALGAALPLDVRQLSWQDRERVLRLLFAKVNRSAAAPKLPPPVARTQQLSEVQAESTLLLPLPLATEAGPAGLA